MEDDDDILLRHIDEEHGFAQAELLGCDRSPDWEVPASSAPSVAGRRTDFRFALAAIASSPVCSLAKKLEGVEVLLSDEYRKIRRRKMARFVSGLRDQDKRAIRTWVELVHRLRPVTMPPPLIESQKHTSDESLMDWLEEHMTLDPAAVSQQRWLYLPRSLLENGQQQGARFVRAGRCSWTTTCTRGRPSRAFFARAARGSAAGGTAAGG